MRAWIFTALLMTQASFAEAFEPDLGILERSSLLDQMEDFGRWEKSAVQDGLVLRCSSCSDPVRVYILVRDHRVSHQGRDLSKAYSAERKAYCQKIVVRLGSRCLGTDEVSIRWLAGYRSQAIEEDRYLTELVLFYGGHALTAIVEETGSFDYGDRLGDFLPQALVRMTPAW